MMEYKTYFDILGLPYTASEQEVKNAYRELSLGMHPDTVFGKPQLEAQADARIKEINTAFSALQVAFKEGRLGTPEKRADDLKRFEMTEALRQAQTRAMEQTAVAADGKKGVDPGQIQEVKGDASDPREELGQTQQKAFEKAVQQPEQQSGPEKVSDGISDELRQAQKQAHRKVQPGPDHELTAFSDVGGESLDRIHRDGSGFPVIESHLIQDPRESKGLSGELVEAVRAVSFIDLKRLPKGWASQWAFAFICLAVWVLLSAVNPVARLMNLQIGSMEKPGQWTVKYKDPGLYQRWLEYQREKQNFLTKYYGRPVDDYESQSWLPPYYLDASAGTAGIDPSAPPPQDFGSSRRTGDINPVLPPDDPAGSQYAPGLPRHNIPTH